MRRKEISLSLIAIVLFVGGVVVNLTSDVLQSILSPLLGIYYNVIVLAIFFILSALAGVRFVRERRLTAEFRNLWRIMSEVLHQDIPQSIKLTEIGRAIARDSNTHALPLHVKPPEIANGNRFNEHHWKIIKGDDPLLFNLLRNYVQAQAELRTIANACNQLMYDLKSESDEFQGILPNLHRASTTLETRSDELLAKVKQLDDVILGKQS